jgi:hypothetical protein
LKAATTCGTLHLVPEGWFRTIPMFTTKLVIVTPFLKDYRPLNIVGKDTLSGGGQRGDSGESLGCVRQAGNSCCFKDVAQVAPATVVGGLGGVSSRTTATRERAAT